MRGYDALVLVDVSRQGGEPGTLYVMEADEDVVEAGIEDGDVIDPHEMDPQTVLRFVKAVGGWPGKVIVIACEPARSRSGHRALAGGRGARSTGRSTSSGTRSQELDGRRLRMHELSIASAIVDDGGAHAGGQPGARPSRSASGACARSCPTSLEFYFGIVARETVCEGARLELEVVPAVLRCGACAHEWELESRPSAAPSARR